MTEKTTRDITGCQRNCHVRQYTLREIYRGNFGTTGRNLTSTFLLSLSISDQKTITESEVYTYGFTNLVADFGGFLGLLLGLSLIDICEYFELGARNLARQATKL